MDRGRGEWVERFRNRLIFPIVDVLGRVVGFGGRALGDEEPKYLNSPESPVFQKRDVLYGLNWTKGAVREKEQVVLVEGYMDFLAVYQAGVPERRRDPRDGPRRGSGPPRQALREGGGAQLRPRRGGHRRRRAGHSGPPGRGHADPDHLGARREGPRRVHPARMARRPTSRLVDEAKPFFDFLVDQSKGALAKGGVEGKVAFLEDVLPYLTAVADPIERQEYAKEVSGRAGLDLGLVLGRLAKAAAGDKGSHGAPAAPRFDVPVDEQLLVKGLMAPAFRRPGPRAR